MPSYTFSSDRLPAVPYGPFWALIVVLVVSAVVGLEVHWREQGHRATIIDDPSWWAIQRQSASQPNAVVLVGASRLKLGFSSRVFHERFPDRPLVRLSVGASLDSIR